MISPSAGVFAWRSSRRGAPPGRRTRSRRTRRTSPGRTGPPRSRGPSAAPARGAWPPHRAGPHRSAARGAARSAARSARVPGSGAAVGCDRRREPAAAGAGRRGRTPVTRSSSSPWATAWPSTTRRWSTVPSRWTSSGCSIFMTSSTTTVWPDRTASPVGDRHGGDRGRHRGHQAVHDGRGLRRQRHAAGLPRDRSPRRRSPPSAHGRLGRRPPQEHPRCPSSKPSPKTGPVPSRSSPTPTTWSTAPHRRSPAGPIRARRSPTAW